MDYSKMTDEELNEAIALKRGWTVVIPDTLWTRGTCANNDIEDTRELPDYTHDWRLAGGLLEEMLSDGGHHLRYVQARNKFAVGGVERDTPQRAICEAWLSWKEQE